MAKILLIDSNPEQQRALSGLIKYRTPYSVVTTETGVEGARAAVAGGVVAMAGLTLLKM